MRSIGPVAKAAAGLILSYVTTRFPEGHQTPACSIDAEWFADAIQNAIDGDTRRKMLDAAGDRRDWDECDRLEGVK